MIWVWLFFIIYWLHPLQEVHFTLLLLWQHHCSILITPVEICMCIWYLTFTSLLYCTSPMFILSVVVCLFWFVNTPGSLCCTQATSTHTYAHTHMRQWALPHKVMGQKRNAKGSVQRMVHVSATTVTTKSNNVDKQRIARRATAVTRLWQRVATSVALDTTETVTTAVFIASACCCRWILKCRSMSSLSSLSNVAHSYQHALRIAPATAFTKVHSSPGGRRGYKHNFALSTVYLLSLLPLAAGCFTGHSIMVAYVTFAFAVHWYITIIHSFSQLNMFIFNSSTAFFLPLYGLCFPALLFAGFI